MNTKKILIVDDEIAIAKALELKLQFEGYETILVENGERAIELIQKNKFDLILLDLLMPKVDGWEVLKTIKGTNSLIIVTSNLGQPEDIDRAKAAGAVDFLVKSNTSLAEIVEKVKSFL